ncbi:MAG: hypothetical protein MJY44_05395 [Bacteroidales bacterium]|nr:hypothetical protein [Bacteroidales bacterium]
MKNNAIKICAILFCTAFLSIDAMAEPRPVWVVGHACNSHRCLQDMIKDGGCGVEIDIHSDIQHKFTEWSVNHGGGFLNKATRDSRNNARDNDLDYYVTLEEYLDFAEMKDISILWLDVKTGEYVAELMQHVHKILEKKYKGKNKQPYSIIYGLYKAEHLETPITPNYTAIDMLRDSLWEKEGINLAFEGKARTQKYGSGTLDDIGKVLSDHNFPPYKHFMSCGWFNSTTVNRYTVEVKSIKAARKLRKENKYCSRVGFWSCGYYSHAIWAISPAWTDGAVDIACDLVLVECRNEFMWPDDQYSLKKLVNYYFKKEGCYYKKYNNDRDRIAKQTDKFYDPGMLGQ